MKDKFFLDIYLLENGDLEQYGQDKIDEFKSYLLKELKHEISQRISKDLIDEFQSCDIELKLHNIKVSEKPHINLRTLTQPSQYVIGKAISEIISNSPPRPIMDVPDLLVKWYREQLK